MLSASSPSHLKRATIRPSSLSGCRCRGREDFFAGERGASALDQIESDIALDRPDVWLRLVIFHRNIVRVAHNEVLLPVFDLIAHLLLEHQVPFYPSIAELQAELRSHRELVALVAARDPDAAAAAMREHLEESEQLRQDALHQDEEG